MFQVPLSPPSQWARTWISRRTSGRAARDASYVLRHRAVEWTGCNAPRRFLKIGVHLRRLFARSTWKLRQRQVVVLTRDGGGRHSPMFACIVLLLVKCIIESTRRNVINAKRMCLWKGSFFGTCLRIKLQRIFYGKIHGWKDWQQNMKVKANGHCQLSVKEVQCLHTETPPLSMTLVFDRAMGILFMLTPSGLMKTNGTFGRRKVPAVEVRPSRRPSFPCTAFFTARTFLCATPPLVWTATGVSSQPFRVRNLPSHYPFSWCFFLVSWYFSSYLKFSSVVVLSLYSLFLPI